MKIQILICILFFSLNIKGEENDKTFKYMLHIEKDSSVFNLDDMKLLQGKTTNFIFPSYRLGQEISYKSYSAKKISKYKRCIEVEVNSNFLTESSYLTINIDLYVENIDSIYIQSYDSQTENKFNYKYPIPQRYTYIPTITVNIPVHKIDTSKNIKIHITSISKLKNSRLILGRFDGSYRVKMNEACNEFELHKKIDSLNTQFHCTGRNNMILDKLKPEISRDRVFYVPELIIEKDKLTNLKDSLNYIHNFVNSFIDTYEFYSDYGLDKNLLQNQHNSIAKESSNIIEYYKKLKNLIAELKNTHFRLDLANDDEFYNPVQPISFYKINNSFLISAVFDTTLLNKVKPGEKLLKINNINIDSLFSMLINRVYATSKHQRDFKVTQRLLTLCQELFSSDTLYVSIENSFKMTYTIPLLLSNSKNRRLPANFNITPKFFFQKKENIAYIKVAFDERFLIPFLYSNKKEILQSEGIVIDFRGNSGGDMSFCNFISLLINQISPIIQVPQTSFELRGKSFNYETLLMKPSKDFYYKGPIIFLIDPRTTCASELMINATKKYHKDTFVLGFANSAGSGQLLQRFILPEKVVLSYFQGRTKDANNNILDISDGVKPDIYLTPKSYRDLAPYDDLLKTYAIEYLKEYKQVKKQICHD